MRSYSIRVGLNPMTNVLIRIREHKHIHTEDHVKIKADIRVRLPQAKKHLRPPEADKGKERFCSRA